MAAPMTHGIPSFFFLVGFLVLSSLGLTGKINPWEFVGVLIFGIGIDIFDHFTSKEYIKDVFRRIKQGGGGPGQGIKIPTSWLHLWPGLFLALVWWALTPSRIWFSIIPWTIHVLIDYFQRTPGGLFHHHFLYPLIKNKIYIKRGYPVKPPIEFVLNGLFWAITAFVLLAILIFG